MLCEVCNREYPSLDKHHIQSKSKGGNNKSYNIAKLCPNCHRQVHLGNIILEGKFKTTGGIILFFHSKYESAIITDDVPDVHIINKV